MIGSRFINAARRHLREETGASLIEYTVVISLFLLVFFAILDFGRLGFNWVMTEKAMQRAARIATVRPPVCTGVPVTHALLSGTTDRIGTLCRTGSACANGGVQQCVLGNVNTFDCTAVTNTAGEIWCTLEPILPSNATPRHIWVSYTYDPQLGFAGGPYTPMIEVGIATADNDNSSGAATNPINFAQELRFEFLTPIPGMAALAGGGAMGNLPSGGGLPSIPFPDMSVSLPGEDLNTGTNG
ncbi:MAG: pilus assembly protein [Silicimonas sp.]